MCRHQADFEPCDASEFCLDAVKVVAPARGSLARVCDEPAWTPFRAETIAFVEALSHEILHGPEYRRFPELIALAYEMRPGKLRASSTDLRADTATGVLRGRGLALHFAPANVDTIFLYSLLLSLLAGNANIVRISSKLSEQVDLVLASINALAERTQFASVTQRMLIIRYEHNEAITRALSERADLRVIWGGDRTVQLIRAVGAQPHTRDIVFPHRWSLAVFDARAFLADPNQQEVARKFANDVFWFGQMACSSPQILAWRGSPDDCERAETVFFSLLESEALRHTRFVNPTDFVNKRVFEDEAAIRAGATIRRGANNLVSVVQLSKNELHNRPEFCGGGLLISTCISQLQDLVPSLDQQIQTIVSFGIANSEWSSLLQGNAIPGVDRIVAPGAALSFNFVWDGMNLLREFTRETTISVEACGAK